MPSPAPLKDSPWHTRTARRLATGQGVYYVLSGVWPLVHVRSFLAVTGPKVDVWLVLTVGALIAVTGAALWLAARRDRLSAEWALLAGGQAASLAAIDIVFVARDRISPIYLGDAVIELALLLGWLVLALRKN